MMDLFTRIDFETDEEKGLGFFFFSKGFCVGVDFFILT